MTTKKRSMTWTQSSKRPKTIFANCRVRNAKMKKLWNLSMRHLFCSRKSAEKWLRWSKRKRSEGQILTMKTITACFSRSKNWLKKSSISLKNNWKKPKLRSFPKKRSWKNRLRLRNSRWGSFKASWGRCHSRSKRKIRSIGLMSSKLKSWGDNCLTKF